MSSSPAPWQPSEILRFIDSFPTGTEVLRVRTDAGDGYLKAMGNAGGEHCLACEWVGTKLARWFKLPTFDFALPLRRHAAFASRRRGVDGYLERS